MKKGFSLAEIMQTVVLLGIIAGLSVSFFRKVNYDERIYTATEKMLIEAVQEAARQVCADDKPVCREQGYAPGCNPNLTYYMYNPDTGYCKIFNETYAGDCESPCFPDPNTMDVEAGIPDCICPPGCCQEPVSPDSCNDYRNTAIIPKDEYCPNGVPVLSKPYANTKLTTFCVKLQNLINHKPQGTTEGNDLAATCGDNTAFNAIAADAVRDVAAITNVINACKNSGANCSDNYNMLLPNGVRLYNLGYSNIKWEHDDANGWVATGSEPAFTIVIKYDSLPKFGSAVYGTNVRVLRFNSDGTIWTGP